MTSLSKTIRVAILLIASSCILAVVVINGCVSRNHYSTATTQPLLSAGLPSVDPLAAIDYQPTPARLERGKYIVEGAAHCFLCHSDIDWSKPGAPYFADKKGAGHKWTDFGFPWLIAPNITPDKKTGAGDWAEVTIARALREGVGHDGRRLFPLMPYMNFRQMSDEDLTSVVAYIRSLRPVKNALPKTQLPESVKNTLPPVEPVTASVPEPDFSDPVKRGSYLVTLANCAECHTTRNEKGEPLPGLDFAGGNVLEGPWGKVATANLTPDPSGISYYDENLFIEVIRTGQVKARKLSSIMPWGYFRNMTDEDLKVIFAYLRALKPVRHRVDNTEPATYCKVCKAMHGYGDRN